jgi:two-component system, NtrC family, response regulator AtoC
MNKADANLIFIVDDDPNQRMIVERWLSRANYEVTSLESGEACLEALSEEQPAAICLDLNMPGFGGMNTLEQIHDHNPLLPVIVLTADDSIDMVVKAMRAGARDYLTKPLDQTKLLTTIANAVEVGRLAMRVSQLEREVEGRGYPGIVGNSEPMRAVFRQLDKLCVSDVTVLIHGESGTGKELIARAIHTNGSRCRGPFVAVNLAAVPETLMESELFGHEKGAFTGAVTRRIGRFEEANRGTLFLDEIGELPGQVQVKLLRVLQERTFQRVGGTARLSSDFRLVTASHRDLEEEVRQARFRQDLYFRLAVFELELPPLRLRRDDIPALAKAFVRQMGEGRVERVSTEALERMMRYDWPGNIRELQNLIQRAVVMCDENEIGLEHLPERIRTVTMKSGAAEAPPEEEEDANDTTLEDFSRRLLVNALTKHDGNASAAMRELNIGRTRFYRMLRKFDLESKIGELRLLK